MKLKVVEGTVRKSNLGKGDSLFLDMPRPPEGARMSFPLDSYFEPFLDKRVRMTIEEKKITIEKLE